MTRLPPVGILITSACLISILASASHGQSRQRLRAPGILLELLDPEDRNCVAQSGLNKSVSVQPIKLASDKSRQILVRGSGLCLCGAQNCLFWIYRKTGSNYELLLKGTGSTKVRAGPASAKGYRDILSESHASAMETILRTYRYDGSQYQPQRCVNRAYYDDNGKYVKQPFDRPCEGETRNEQDVILTLSNLDQELTTIDHHPLKLSDYPDKTIVLNIFASWCAACRMNLPDLIDLKQKYNSHPIEVIGWVSKKNDPDIDEVRKFVHNQGVNFPVVWDTEDSAEALLKPAIAREVLPITLIIDRSGKVRKSFLGFNPNMTPRLLRETLDRIGSEPEKGNKSP